jgi:hypothetical protein
LVAVISLHLASCGGGGGGGSSEGAGAPGTGDPPADTSVSFLGFSFRSGSGAETAVPPLEDLAAVPPSVGAPLNLTVIFHFDGVPSGPFTQQSLPVFTTPTNVTPEAGASPSQGLILAKGTYVLMVDEGLGLFTVEFHPFVPTAVLQVPLSSPPESVPGLLPGSVYTAMVSTALTSKITNLVLTALVLGPGGTVDFGTTSNAAAYYPKDVSDDDPPALASSAPLDGATDFFPSTFSTVPLSSTALLFPPGPEDFLLTYDRSVEPTADNLFGRDFDSDGVLEPTFFLAADATEFLVGHSVAAGTFSLGHAEFSALSGLSAGAGPDAIGADIVLHDSTDGGLAGPSAAMLDTPSALAVDNHPSLLWVVFPRVGDTDLLGLTDYVLGDPSQAALSLDGLGGIPLSLDTGLSDLVALESLHDGRLVGFDLALGKLVELAVEYDRQRPTPLKPSQDAPVLESLTTGVTDASLFLSDAWPAGVEVLDLAQAPSGALYALVRLTAGAFPSIVKVSLIDPDVNGVFEPGEGLFSGAGADVVLTLVEEYAALEFVSEREVLALNRTTDSLDLLSLDTGVPTLVTSNVAAFGASLASFPDGLSPATTLALGRMEIDVSVSLQSNTEAGAVVRVQPVGVLPVDAELTLMQRNAFTSLFGKSELNADPSSPQSPLGAVELLSVTTAAPAGGSGAPIADVFFEDFINDVFENGQPLSTSPLAEWAEPVVSAATSGSLRASVGVSETANLGDFLPQAKSNFNPSKAWIASTPPWTGVHDAEDNEELALDMGKANYNLILLNTDIQRFPLPDGSTAGVTAPVDIFNGVFIFRDFIIPEGVHVVVRGSNPLRITATGRVEIRGMLDIRGTDGLSDDTFDSGFLAVPGGPGGPGGGRGGDAHPTLFDPTGTGALDQFVTPERSERGFGSIIDATGKVTLVQNGGFGGLSTVGYEPNGGGFPAKGLNAKANGDVPNTEHHRPPGGGGGSFYQVGRPAHQGTGAYLVESDSTWFPFGKCLTNDKKQDALYGNDENIAAGVPNSYPLQCVYQTGTVANPDRFKPGGLPGDLVFTDGDPTNDFIGVGGELPVLIGGQGGGGGGTRIDSIKHINWSVDHIGSPLPTPPAPPFYPNLLIGIFVSPTVFDAKGGAGGGGGGGVQIRSFGDILITKTGHIDCRGGHGGGGEVVQNSNTGGGGGGGSGGTILLHAAGKITIEADEGHEFASYTDTVGKDGASLEVSGGFGKDAQTETPTKDFTFKPYTYEWTRSDGGQGGMGMIQLQAGSGADSVSIDDGAFLFAKLRPMMKRGLFTGDTSAFHGEHPDWPGPNDKLRYIDIIDQRSFKMPKSAERHYMVLNGSNPPIIPSADGNNGPLLTNEFPAGSGQFWGDTVMSATVHSGGVPVVQDPEPERMMKTYAGYDPETFIENFTNPQFLPGELWDATDVIPLSLHLNEPDGTPLTVDLDGQEIFDPANTVDRLPVVPLSTTPPPIGTLSVGRSVWLDFSGAALRARSLVSGRTPPFFEGFNGTHNVTDSSSFTAEQEGQVQLGAPVSPTSIPARYVVNAGFTDPGLNAGTPVGSGTPPNPPYNDFKVQAPDVGIALDDVLTDNAAVKIEFQGAYALRAGSHLPDVQTITPWVSDLTELSGYPLIRFQVSFDLGQDLEGFPFGPESMRPQLDYLRLRVEY